MSIPLSKSVQLLNKLLLPLRSTAEHIPCKWVMQMSKWIHLNEYKSLYNEGLFWKVELWLYKRVIP